jgi:hypothetical protein
VPYPWLVVTRYFSTTVWLLVAPLPDVTELSQPRAAARLSHAAASGAVAILYERVRGRAAPGSWERLQSVWAALSESDPTAEICLALGLSGEGEGDGNGRSDGGSGKLEWCLDAGLEWIEAEMSAGEIAAAAAMARGSGARSYLRTKLKGW